MSFPALLVREAVVHRMREEGADRYGSPERVQFAAVTYPAWLEQRRTSEELMDRNAVREDDLLILPAYADVGPLDWIEVDGVAYEIDGAPARVWRGLGGGREHHVEVTVRAVTGK